MGINIGNILKGGVGAILKVAGDHIGLGPEAAKLANAIMGTPEQPTDPIIQAELDRHVEAMAQAALEEKKVDASVITADDDVEKTELQSSDKFTSRARPTLLYLAGFITAALSIALIFGVKIDTGAVAELLIPLWGHAGFYTYQRSQEKKATIAALTSTDQMRLKLAA